MPLDIDNMLTPIRIRFFTPDTNEATFCTRVNSCSGKNVRNIRLHQCIISTNPDILKSCMKFYDEIPFDPIRLNFSLGEERNNLKGKLTSLLP